MNTKIQRHEAEKLYADWVMGFGNPVYFINKGVRDWDDEYLIEQLEEVGICGFEIVEEEEG